MTTSPLVDFDAIRTQNKIEDVIESYLGPPLSRGSWYTWPCPFHPEGRTPNFKVNIKTQRFECFSGQCRTRGDVFDFVQRYMNLDSGVEAARLLGGLVLDLGLSPEEKARKLAEIKRQRQEREAQRKAQDQAERQAVLEQIAGMQSRVDWYRSQGALAYSYWKSQGISNQSILSYQLGYAPACPAWPDSPSYVIPVYHDGRLVSIRHRLARPPREGDKYRPEFKGLPAQLFIARSWKPEPVPDDEIPFDASPLKEKEGILVEGEVKAIVLGQFEFPVAGLPGVKGWQTSWLNHFEHLNRVYICLDPGVDKFWIGRIAQDLLGASIQPVIIKLPAKPDDFFVRHKGTIREFMAYLRWGRVVK